MHMNDGSGGRSVRHHGALILGLVAVLLVGLATAAVGDHGTAIVAPTEGSFHSAGEVLLEAHYDDADDNPDGVQWAVRDATCERDPGAVVAGNVAGHSDPYEFDGTTFTATVTLDPGEYCFVFNPVEDTGADDVRLTSTFYVYDAALMGGGQIIEDVGPKPKDDHKVSFGSGLYRIGAGEYAGSLTVTFHNVRDDDLDKSTFTSDAITDMNFFDNGGDPCDAANATVTGELDGEPGYTVTMRAGDNGEPGDMDTVRFTLAGPDTYDTMEDFTQESDCVGTVRTGLDRGNLQVVVPPSS